MSWRMSLATPLTLLLRTYRGGGGVWEGEGAEAEVGGEVQYSIDDVMDIPGRQQGEVCRRACLLVHRWGDGLSSRLCGTGPRGVQLRRRPWSFPRCPCSRQRQVPASTSSSSRCLSFSSSSACWTFLLCHSDASSANCAADRRDPTGACAVLGWV